MNFAIQGIAVGFPWNALLSSTDYYRNQLNETASLASLEAALTLTYVLMNLITFAWLNRPSASKESLTQEMSYIRIFFAVNLVTFTLLGISPWLPEEISENHGLFATVVVVGGILGLTSAFFQHAIFAIAARDGPSRTRAYLFGFAIAGTLASAAALGTRSFADPEFTAALNFGTTVFSLLIGFGSFSCRGLNSRLVDGVTATMPANVQPITEDAYVLEESPPASSASSSLDEADDHRDHPLMDKKKLRVSLAVVAGSLAGTLLVFPALVASFKPMTPGQDPHEFTSVLFLFFNVGDLTGRGLASVLTRFSDGTLLALILCRTASLGFFAMCNRSETSDDKSLIDDSFVYALVMSQGILGGALFSAAAARAPKAIPSDPGKAGKIVAATIAVALAAGGLGGTILISMIE